MATSMVDEPKMITELEIEDDGGLGEEVPSPCCRCGATVAPGQEVFDCDGCPHSCCVQCRFQDYLGCRICCKTQHFPSVSSSDHLNEPPDPLTSVVFNPKKKHNTDHIVDVESEGSTQKQMCTVCQRVFKKSNARYHYACASGDKPFSCVECQRKFVKKSHLQAHLNSHYGIKPFKCTHRKCKASFTQKDKLVRHMKTHSKDHKFTCSLCGKNYSTQPILSVHMQKVHAAGNIKPHQCDLCPRSYKYKRSLKVHRLKHQSIRDHMCDVCGKKYPLFCQLRLHKRSHVVYQRRPHKCSCLGCSRRFMTRADRARHELIHMANNDFECSLCNTTFSRKDNLERHMKNLHLENSPLFRRTTKLTAAITPFNSRPNTGTPAGNGQEKNTNKGIAGPKSKQNKLKKCKTVRFLDSAETRRKSESSRKKPLQKNKLLRIDNISIELDDDRARDSNQSVIVSPKPSDNQNRPSVIKNIPKLLPYRILPPEKRFLKMSEEINRNARESSLGSFIGNESASQPQAHQVHPLLSRSAPQLSRPVAKSKNTASTSKQPLNISSTSKTSINIQRKRRTKDDALNRCFRIIPHTQVKPVLLPAIPSSNSARPYFDTAFNRPSGTFQSNMVRNYASQIVSIQLTNTTIVSTNNLVRGINALPNFPPNINTSSSCSRIDEEQHTSNVGGPSLPANIPEPNTDANTEDTFSHSYMPLAESPCTSYTPYFDNECFKESVSSYYEGGPENFLANDLDMGFHGIHDHLACGEINFSSETKVVIQETQVNKEPNERNDKTF